MDLFLLLAPSGEESMDAFQNWWAEATRQWPVFILKIIGILVIVLISVKLIRFVSRKLDVLLAQEFFSKKLEDKYRKIICSCAESVLYVLIAFVALNYLGVPMNSILYALITIFVALVVALKDYISIVASGIILVFSHPFGINDVINVCGGTVGKVTIITLFHTVLTTFDKQTIYVPNNQILSGTIINLSLEKERVLDLKFAITYESDLKKAKEVLIQIMTETPLRVKENEPSVVVSSLADSYVEMQCRVVVLNADYWKAKWELTEQVKLGLDANGIDFAYPQMTIHTKN